MLREWWAGARAKLSSGLISSRPWRAAPERPLPNDTAVELWAGLEGGSTVTGGSTRDREEEQPGGRDQERSTRGREGERPVAVVEVDEEKHVDVRSATDGGKEVGGHALVGPGAGQRADLAADAQGRPSWCSVRMSIMMRWHRGEPDKSGEPR